MFGKQTTVWRFAWVLFLGAEFRRALIRPIDKNVIDKDRKKVYFNKTYVCVKKIVQTVH